MSRFGSTVRTYGRAPAAPKDNASMAFDTAIFGSKPSPSMTTSTVHRFGTYSFTSSRAKETEVEPRKRKVEEPPDAFDDPFSFDSDGDDGGGKKSKTSQKASGGASSRATTYGTKGKKAAGGAAAASSNGRTLNTVIIARKKKVHDDDEDEFVVKKGPAKTYSSKSNSADAAKKSKSTTTDTKRRPGLSSSSTSTSKQLTMDSFTRKLATLSPPPKSLAAKDCIFPPGGSKKNSGAQKPVVKKFFTSSQEEESGNTSDHNYSVSPIRTSGGDSDNESCASENSFLSDMKLDSGDPEIVFNSPQKKGEPDEKRSDISLEDRVSPTASVDSLGIDTDMTSITQPKFSSGVDTGRAVSPAISLHSVDSDDFSSEYMSSSQFQPKATKRTYSSKLLLRKSGSEVSGICKKESIPTFNMSGLGATYGKAKPGGQKNAEGERKFTNLAGKKLKDEEKKPKTEKKVPLVRRLLTSPKKPAARYNVRSWNAEEVAAGSHDDKSASGGEKAQGNFDFDTDEETPAAPPPAKKKVVKEPVALRRTVTWPTRQGDDAIMSVKVQKEHKELFTVVRNVKQAHEVQEFGETQEFEDDIEYIMEGLHNGNQRVAVRCLSCVSLVNKCTLPAFRMHLRAHGTMTKVFGALQDAPKYPSLALCTAAVLFMLSRDRLNMDVEKSVLELMLQLLNVDTNRSSPEKTPQGNKEYQGVKAKITQVCEKVKADGAARHLNTETLTAGSLAMEALLTLTSKRAGDWFKEDLRLLGGLDHLIKTIGDCVDSMAEFEVDPSEYTLLLFGKVDRCLRVLEQVTFLNAENQSYLIAFKSSLLIKSLCRILRMCENILPFNEVIVDCNDKPEKECIGYVVFSCCTCVLKVLLNLTHDNHVGSSKVGQQQGLVKCILNLMLQVPKYVTIDQRFELLVLCLGLFINMVEHCDSNRQMIIDTCVHNSYEAEYPQSSTPALQCLVQLFVIRYNTAQILEREQEEEKNKILSKKPGVGGGDPERDDLPAHPALPELTASQQSAANESGVWKESESGLEWIALPSDNKGDDNSSVSSEDDRQNGLSNSQNSQEDSEEKLISKVLHKAGRHMEDSIIAAYISLLVGIIIQNNSDLVENAREHLPEGNFDNMILMLKKFLGFMNLTTETNTGSKSIRNVIQILEDC